jgi:tetratricopeptide (TPR) repeat protein
MKTTMIILAALWANLQITMAGEAGTWPQGGSQQKIEQAFGAALRQHDLSEMDQVEKELTTDYWMAYSQYFRAIYLLKTGDNEGSREKVEAGIERLKSIKTKSSEDYALLSVMRSFSIQFVDNVMKQGMLSGQVRDEARKAIRLDDQNLRAYYALGSIDFYTPKEYGGVQEAEKLLLKAVSLEEQQAEGNDLPTWGKDFAYQMLVSLYLKNNDPAQAKRYWEEAHRLYPDNEMINGLGFDQ